MKAKIKSWVNGYLPPNWQMTPMRAEYSNILLIAATNRGDSLDAALLRPGRFDRRLYFDVPTKHERRDLIDFFLDAQGPRGRARRRGPARSGRVRDVRLHAR